MNTRKTELCVVKYFRVKSGFVVKLWFIERLKMTPQA